MKKSEINQSTVIIAESCICRSCRGSGIFGRKIISFDQIEITCSKCEGGWISVKCNSCKGSKKINDVSCKTCKGTGKYVYKPTFKFPEGKPCKFCNGTGKIKKKINVVSEAIKCKTCDGKGTINRDHLFNPLVKVDVLNKILDGMVFPVKKKSKKKLPDKVSEAIIKEERSVVPEVSV